MDGFEAGKLDETVIEVEGLGFGVSVIEAHHSDGMLDLEEAVDGGAADAAGGGVRRGEVGEGQFEGGEFGEEGVEFAVGDDWAGVEVVEPVMAVDFRGEGRDSEAGVVGGHGRGRVRD